MKNRNHRFGRAALIILALLLLTTTVFATGESASAPADTSAPAQAAADEAPAAGESRFALWVECADCDGTGDCGTCGGTGEVPSSTAAILSLLLFCATLVVAFVFKLNSGLVAIVVALLLSWVTGVSETFLLAAFDSKMFLMLLGVMYLFSIAQENKTLELLSKKTFAMCKGNARLLPIVIFLISALLSAIGPGLISVTALIAVLIVSLAREIGVPAIHLAPFGLLGSFAGGLTPITPSGVVAITVAEKSGVSGVALALPVKMAITCTAYAVILYLFVFKWHKKQRLTAQQDTVTPPFSAKQIATLAGIVVVAVVSTVFGINVGLASFAVAVVLTLFKVADEGAALKKVPWSTLIMITGVGILISLVTELGGIKLLTKWLQALATTGTADAIMAVLAGVMSWFSSASGVVMPTLFPVAAEMAGNMPGVDALGVVTSVGIGAHLAAMSPLSSCGGLMLAAYSSSGDVTAESRNKMFLQLFLLSAFGVLFGGILALLGLY